MKLRPTNGWTRGPMKPLFALDFFKKKFSTNSYPRDGYRLCGLIK